MHKPYLTIHTASVSISIHGVEGHSDMTMAGEGGVGAACTATSESEKVGPASSADVVCVPVWVAVGSI